MSFVDKTQIKVKAGDGGSGSCSFRREKFIPKGGPDGGDGGAGGNVILEASTGESSLVSLVFKRSSRAKNGTNGAGKGLYGHKGDDLILKVPVGTVVRDLDSGEIMAMMLLLLLLADGNEESESVVTTLLIFLFL